tara:strand:- start:737 stop:940 length:204 start_codon:yes stop_codon:yes gene_type:complete
MKDLMKEAEEIAVEHWLWLRQQAPRRNYTSIYKMLGRPPPRTYEGPNGIIETMAEIWMEELAGGRDT